MATKLIASFFVITAGLYFGSIFTDMATGFKHTKVLTPMIFGAGVMLILGVVAGMTASIWLK